MPTPKDQHTVQVRKVTWAFLKRKAADSIIDKRMSISALIEDALDCKYGKEWRKFKERVEK